MNGVVVDASAILAWVLDEDSDARAAMRNAIEAREQCMLRAPALIADEVANALQSSVRRKRLSAEQAQSAALLVDALDLALDRDVGTVSDALTSAITHGLTSYDATYLRLALRTGAALLTGDAALAAAAARVGVQVLPRPG